MMNKKQSGFTLIEILLYVALVTLMVSMIVPLFIDVINSSNKSVTQQILTTETRYAALKLGTLIRSSSGINNGSSFGTNLSNNPGSYLSLVGTGTNNPIIVDVLDGRLRVKYGAGSFVNLTSSDVEVSSLVFTNNSSVDLKTQNITIEMTVRMPLDLANNTYTGQKDIRTSIEIRNE